MWNGTMFVDLDWPLNASSLLSASAELLVYSKCTAAAAWCVNAAVSKATGWPWPLTFWPWKWCASHNYYRKSPFAVFFSLSCALKHNTTRNKHVLIFYCSCNYVYFYSVVYDQRISYDVIGRNRFYVVGSRKRIISSANMSKRQYWW